MNSNQEQLYAAVYRGEINEIKALLKRSTDVNSSNEHGKTLLMLAIVGGQLDIVKYLITKGANLHIKDKQGKNALDYILEYGVIDRLPEKESALKEQLLFGAIRLGNIEVVQQCLEQGISAHYRDWLDRPLVEAVTSQRVDIAKLLLAKEVDFTEEDSVDILDFVLQGMEFGPKGWNEVFEILKEKGVQFEKQHLLHAVRFGCLNVVKQCLDQGVSVHCRDWLNRSLIEVAVANECFDIIKWLLENGAHPTVEGIGISKYIESRQYHSQGWDEVIALLGQQKRFLNDIKQGNLKAVAHSLEVLSVNFYSEFGLTPLIQAIRHKQGTIIKLLLDHPKLDINAKDLKDQSALDHVLLSKSGDDNKRKLIDSLMQKGAAPTIKMFHFCAVNNFTKGMRYCLRYGVEIGRDNTALTLVAKSGLSDNEKIKVMKMLLSWGADSEVALLKKSSMDKYVALLEGRVQPSFKDLADIVLLRKPSMIKYAQLLKSRAKYYLKELNVSVSDQEPFVRDFLFFRSQFIYSKKAYFDPFPFEIKLMILEKIVPSFPFASSTELASLIIKSVALNLPRSFSSDDTSEKNLSIRAKPL